ncbi:MAG: alpha-1,2-fucosyltransferase [Bacteroidia bacterium]|nr:alpha-1,2-fucosyltransferase [Bacteroidia bacterium]MCC6769522.1 alpha-1,2-fucosyltransferase [Bacteroidia bacterium]
MIVTKIYSGLGNQLFQYAAGKSLAAHHNTDLKIDNSWYYTAEEKQTPRTYDLGVFHFPEPIATHDEIRQFTHPAGTDLLGRLKARYYRGLPNHKKPVYQEPHFHFDTQFFNSRKSTMLSGYWQSEKYFLPLAATIRQAFSLQVTGEQNLETARKINSSTAISLHVRRGDMVHNPDVARVHGSCDLAYYQEAARRIVEQIASPEFFIFSDDPQWCLQHLKLDYPVNVVANNQGDMAWQDMQLMRMCKHHIIANSSFSWWGAWLNPSAEKKVIAPARWFNTGNHDLSDLLPAGWMRL